MDEKTVVKGLYRSSSDGALINKDNSALMAYKKRKAAAKLTVSLEMKVNALEQTIRSLEKRLEILESR